MLLLGLIVVLVVFLFWSKREGFTEPGSPQVPPMPSTGSKMGAGPMPPGPTPGVPSSQPSLVMAEDCTTCIGGNNLWNKVTNQCSSTPFDGFMNTCA